MPKAAIFGLAAALSISGPAAGAERAQPQEEAVCRRDFSLDALLKESVQTKALPSEFTGHKGPLIQDLEWYHYCLALADDNVERCDPLRALDAEAESAMQNGFTGSAYQNCAAYFFEMTMIGALEAHSPRAQEACVKEITRTNMDPRSPERFTDVPAFCAAIANYTEPESTCAKIAPYINAYVAKRCESFVKILNGAQDCAAGVEGGQDRALCPEYLAYKKAVTAKGIESCGDHGLCRALMGGGERACRPGLERLKAEYCSLRAKYGAASPPAERSVLEVPALDTHDEASCLKTFSIDGLLQDSNKRKALPAKLADHKLPLVKDLEAYYQCKALVARDPGECDALRALDSETEKEFMGEISEHCSEYYYELRWVRALVTRSPDATAACVESVAHTPTRSNAHKKGQILDVSGFCAALSGYTTPTETCAKLAPYVDARQAEHCPSMIGILNGDSQDCEGKALGGLGRSFCRDSPAFHRAFAAKDIGLCGDLTLCRVFMGGGARTCQPIADKIKDEYCGLMAGHGSPGGEPTGP